MEGLHPTLRQRREGWGTRFLLAGEREQDNSGDAHRVPPLHPTLRQRREGWGTRFVLAGGERTRTTVVMPHRVHPPPRIILSGLNLLKNSRSKSTIRTC